MRPESRIRLDAGELYLTQNGEVAGSLNPYKGRLRRDFVYLEESGLPIFSGLFKRSTGDEIPYSKPANVLKRSVYEIGSQLMDKDNGHRLADFVQEIWRKSGERLVSESAPEPDENPFFWCYHLLYSTSLGVSRDQRSKSSRQLVYAYKNKVPSDLLIGFLLQIGGDVVLDLNSEEAWDGWKSAKKISKQKKTVSDR